MSGELAHDTRLTDDLLSGTPTIDPHAERALEVAECHDRHRREAEVRLSFGPTAVIRSAPAADGTPHAALEVHVVRGNASDRYDESLLRYVVEFDAQLRPHLRALTVGPHA